MFPLLQRKVIDPVQQNELRLEGKNPTALMVFQHKTRTSKDLLDLNGNLNLGVADPILCSIWLAIAATSFSILLDIRQLNTKGT